MVELVNTLHIDTVYKKTEEEALAELRKVESERIAQLTESTSNTVVDDEMQSPFQKLLYQKVNEQKSIQLSNNIVPTVFEQHYENKRKSLREKVQSDVQCYIKYCTSLNISELLDLYGTEEYYVAKKNKDKILNCVLTNEDPLLASKYFNLLKWWKSFGSNEFQKLGTAAAIVLGKPTHNAFQERVFSRGTYQDSKLKKRIGENEFEMAILNALNFKSLEQLQREIVVKRADCSRLVESIKTFFKRQEDKDIIVELPQVDDEDVSVLDTESNDAESVDTVESERKNGIVDFDEDESDLDSDNDNAIDEL